LGSLVLSEDDNKTGFAVKRKTSLRVASTKCCSESSMLRPRQFRFTGSAKTANSADFDSEARSQLREPRVPFFRGRYALSIAEIREAQSHPKHPPAAAQGSARDPGIESDTHEGRQLTWLLQNGSQYGDGVSRAIGTQPDQGSWR
jgi:hypothetical protein